MSGADGNLWPLARFVVVCTIRGQMVSQHGSLADAKGATSPSRVVVDRKTGRIVDPWVSK